MDRNVIKWWYLTDREGKPIMSLRGWDDLLAMRFELGYDPDGWTVCAVYHRETAFGINPEPTYEHIYSGGLVECMAAAEKWASSEYENIVGE